MQRHCKSTSIILFSLVLLFLSVRVDGQTLEEAMRENAELKEKLKVKVIEENNRLKAQLAGFDSEKPPTTTTTTAATTVSTAVVVTPTATPSPSSTPIPATAAETIDSVCEQQRLDKNSYSRYDKQICDLAAMLVNNLPNTKKPKLERTTTGESIATFFIAKLAGIEKVTDPAAKVNKDLRAFILDAENKRNDKQVGADAKSGGSTSLAVKGGIPRFLSWATEHGAVVGSRSGNILTFRVNPIGLLDSFSSYRPIEGLTVNDIFATSDSFTNILKKFSLGFSFDITRGNETPLFTGSKQQLSAFAVRYNFINDRDPLSKKYVKYWELFKNNVVQTYAAVAGRQFNALVCEFVSTPPCTTDKYYNADLEKWVTDTEAKLATVKTEGRSKLAIEEEIRKILTSSLDSFPIEKMKTDASLVQTLLQTGKGLLDYNVEFKKLQDKIANGTIVTLEYTNYREVNAPDVSNVRFIAEKGLGADWSLTANASISFLNKKPTAMNVKRIRDFDFTLQLEKPLPWAKDSKIGPPVFSFAGQWQRLPGIIVGPDGLLKPNTKGDTAIGQFKLVIPIKDTGIKLPFSLTFANRSELIKESTVRGNFGFTFDLDRLLFGRKLF